MMPPMCLCVRLQRLFCGVSEMRAKMRGQARRMQRWKFSESAHASNHVWRRD